MSTAEVVATDGKFESLAQLNSDSPAFDDFDCRQDVIWMAEVAAESTHVGMREARIVMFLANLPQHYQSL